MNLSLVDCILLSFIATFKPWSLHAYASTVLREILNVNLRIQSNQVQLDMLVCVASTLLDRKDDTNKQTQSTNVFRS